MLDLESINKEQQEVYEAYRDIDLELVRACINLKQNLLPDRAETIQMILQPFNVRRCASEMLAAGNGSYTYGEYEQAIANGFAEYSEFILRETAS